jgi:hypothetical protein
VVAAAEAQNAATADETTTITIDRRASRDRARIPAADRVPGLGEYGVPLIAISPPRLAFGCRRRSLMRTERGEQTGRDVPATAAPPITTDARRPENIPPDQIPGAREGPAEPWARYAKARRREALAQF